MESTYKLSASQVFEWYNNITLKAGDFSYHDFLKKELGIELIFVDDNSNIEVIIKDRNKFLLGKLKYEWINC